MANNGRTSLTDADLVKNIDEQRLSQGDYARSLHPVDSPAQSSKIVCVGDSRAFTGQVFVRLRDGTVRCVTPSGPSAKVVLKDKLVLGDNTSGRQVAVLSTKLQSNSLLGEREANPVQLSDPIPEKFALEKRAKRQNQNQPDNASLQAPLQGREKQISDSQVAVFDKDSEKERVRQTSVKKIDNSTPDNSKIAYPFTCNVLPSKPKLYELPDVGKAILVRLPDSFASEKLQFEKCEKRQRQDRAGDAPLQAPSQMEEQVSSDRPTAKKKNDNTSRVAPTPSEDIDRLENEAQSCQNSSKYIYISKDNRRYNFYVKKWKECFNQRKYHNMSTSNRSTKLSASLSKSCKTAKSSNSLSYDPPDEEVASVLWRLSLGQTVTIEEVDKVIMYLVKLKYTFCDKGNKVAQSQEREATHVEHPGRTAFPSPAPIPEKPDSHPKLPELESLDDEPPVIEANPLRSPAPMKRRASPQKNAETVKKAKMSVTDESLQAPSRHVHQVVNIPKGSVIKLSRSRKSSKCLRTPPHFVVRFPNTTESSVTEPPPQTLRTNKQKSSKHPAPVRDQRFTCEQCGMHLHGQECRHMRLCKGVLVKPTREINEEPCAAAEEEERNKERKCPKCSEVFPCDKDFEMHMAVAHRFHWCYWFNNEEEFDAWFHEEGFNDTMVLLSQKRSSTRFFQCVSTKCPCRISVTPRPEGLYVKHHVLHNHADMRQRSVRFGLIDLKCPPRQVALMSHSDEEQTERMCTVCRKVLNCVKDYEMHMAVAHNYMWRFHFDSEEEFQEWFRSEGFDECMVGSKKNFNKMLLFCPMNKNNQKQSKSQKAVVGTTKPCKCRLYITRKDNRICAKYFPLHNHSNRIVRSFMTRECREMIIKMVKDGIDNHIILKTIKDTFPATSVNQFVDIVKIRNLRLQTLRKERSEPRSVLPNTQVVEVTPQNMFDASRAQSSSACVAGESSAQFVDDGDVDSVVNLPSPKSDESCGFRDSDHSLNE